MTTTVDTDRRGSRMDAFLRTAARRSAVLRGAGQDGAHGAATPDGELSEFSRVRTTQGLSPQQLVR